MKKIFTLVFSLGIISISFAQSGHSNYPDNRDSRGVILGQPTRGDNDRDRSMNQGGQRERMIQQINQQYDYKIQQVQRDSYLRNGQKKREIRSLEQQRARQLQQLNSRYANTNTNRRYDNDNTNRRYDDGNTNRRYDDGNTNRRYDDGNNRYDDKNTPARNRNDQRD